MHQLNLPEYDYKVKREHDKEYIFDVIRKKYLVLTPEEWVRQHVVSFLINHKHFPKSFIVIEKGLVYNEMQKRADVLIYSQQLQPLFLVECKAPHIKISEATFEQIARYNMVFKVPYLLVTNGMSHYCCKIDFEKESYTFLEDIPDYELL
ncbi:MAG: type I restriction enzyme HsdR N-terminal domain-containing protein [Flavobacteriales bacterium]|nr:type I restriction enzyme HsdR N-terminal domain-containing protein [Flavobacteriales bacterium]MCW8914084.1 type I restriction enzyme HsdR N-terminal domain-containing protein [Flavobacteriales bacterium]MCW8938142.1 type I restriction enzyme HsdR N-terminal domain-containing protein [Flavobacteriales bacterium]MCW8939781.1 type I restriction enzyme HsdR N-terminal domain-containing protein [Flavobacteriales bacterium]MCW8968239.1 type I restriction enzyme HsdR N-terminal domain-containing 